MSISISQAESNCNQHSRDIDNELLIQEIKCRPALYSRSVKEYNDQHFKKTMWEEICAKIYHDVWDGMSERQKEARCVEVLKRWTNLRTCFSRELKIMRDPLQIKRKKYIYFDKLLFLLEDARSDNMFTFEEPETLVMTNSSFDHEDNIEHNSILKKSLERKSNAERRTKIRDIEKYVQNSINKLRKEFTKKDIAKDSTDSKPETLNTDADTNFSLSLVPMLKMIPVDKKIDAQIEILSILKKYTKRIDFTCDYSMIKYESYDDRSEGEDHSEETSYYSEEK